MALLKTNRLLPYIVLLIVAAGCGDDSINDNTKETITPTSTISTSPKEVSESIIDNEEKFILNEYETYYILVADTSEDYYYLRKKMFQIRDKLNLTIDTMGRYYNPNKNLIMLPSDDEDEIYAGDYFPRRFPSDNLSLEYMVLYKNDSREKTISLVRGIYENKNRMDSALTVLKVLEPNSFYIETEIFVGCMH